MEQKELKKSVLQNLNSRTTNRCKKKNPKTSTHYKNVQGSSEFKWECTLKIEDGSVCGAKGKNDNWKYNHHKTHFTLTCPRCHRKYDVRNKTKHVSCKMVKASVPQCSVVCELTLSGSADMEQEIQITSGSLQEYVNKLAQDERVLDCMWKQRDRFLVELIRSSQERMTKRHELDSPKIQIKCSQGIVSIIDTGKGMTKTSVLDEIGYFLPLLISVSVQIDVYSKNTNDGTFRWQTTDGQTFTIIQVNSSDIQTSEGSCIKIHLKESMGHFTEERFVKDYIKEYCAFSKFKIFYKEQSSSSIMLNYTGDALTAPQHQLTEKVEELTHFLYKESQKCVACERQTYSEPFSMTIIVFLFNSTDRHEVRVYNHGFLVNESWYTHIIPAYLPFIRGIICFENAPLKHINEKRIYELLSEVILTQTLKMLTSLMSHMDVYRSIYQREEMNIKRGIHESRAHRSKFCALMLWTTSVSSERINLEIYVNRMPTNQMYIYYAHEMPIKDDIEVILPQDADEVFALMTLKSFDGVPIKCLKQNASQFPALSSSTIAVVPSKPIKVYMDVNEIGRDDNKFNVARIINALTFFMEKNIQVIAIMEENGIQMSKMDKIILENMKKRGKIQESEVNWSILSDPTSRLLTKLNEAQKRDALLLTSQVELKIIKGTGNFGFDLTQKRLISFRFERTQFILLDKNGNKISSLN